jgi:hypothetical protein
MRMNLRTHPKVVRMASALQADRLRVIGGLHAVWCMADEHTEDGNLPGYSLAALDESISWPGFASAMKAIDWLIESPHGLELPRFDEHNGASAKRRAQESERKRRDRKTSAPNADKKRTREEKRRSNTTPIVPVGFDLFWKAYPRKIAKPDALQAWRRLLPDADLTQKILAAVERARSTEQWLRDDGRFIPHPATWLNKRRFEDEVIDKPTQIGTFV